MKEALIGFGTAAILIWLWESGKLKNAVAALPGASVIDTGTNTNTTTNEDITEIEFIP